MLAKNRTDEIERLVERFDCPLSDIAGGQMSHFEAANSIYMASRNDLDLLSQQTKAKERIRWLAVRVEKLEAELAKDKS